MAEGYCPKCKARTAIGHAVAAVLKNGRRAVKGHCVSCGRSLFKILDRVSCLDPADSEGLRDRPSRFRGIAPDRR